MYILPWPLTSGSLLGVAVIMKTLTQTPIQDDGYAKAYDDGSSHHIIMLKALRSCLFGQKFNNH